ncbi:MAG: aconitase X catalytic domain-containing protein, partial [Gammaproteobacteria bacterium]|nr:aconitase X catalytic domain-containing protein [Gammaproteobacteria bacterium]
MRLTTEERAILDGVSGDAAAMAMRIVSEMARIQGAERLVPIRSAHIDGCLYHGKSGVDFAERLAAGQARVAVPSSLNVGALDLQHPEKILLPQRERDLARRLMNAYVAMGCIPTWTCAPYQAGCRPKAGEDVAWAESNAIVFANSVLGARTNRYGDFMDICCALTGRAPYVGLHRPENRFAKILIDTGRISSVLKQQDVLYPVLGSWLGRIAGDEIAVFDGLSDTVSEDQLKALGASAASSGGVALFHVAGVTPEASTVETALNGQPPRRRIELTPESLIAERDRMSTAGKEPLDVVAVGSPHFSVNEFAELLRLLNGRRCALPLIACTGRHVTRQLAALGWEPLLAAAGVELLVDTCVVVTTVLERSNGVLMTNSGKFAHYSPSL